MDPKLDLGAVHDACRARWVSAVLEERQLTLPLEGITVRPEAAAVAYEAAPEVRAVVARVVSGRAESARITNGRLKIIR